MNGQHRRGGRLGWLVWLGRVIGLGASGLFLAFFFGEGVPEMAAGGIPRELLAFIPLLLVAVAGCVLALFRQRADGWLQIAGGTLMGAYHLVHGGLHDLNMAIAFGAPFILAGAIMVLYSRDEAAAAA